MLLKNKYIRVSVYREVKYNATGITVILKPIAMLMRSIIVNCHIYPKELLACLFCLFYRKNRNHEIELVKLQD